MVLDFCSGAGGKSLAISHKLNNTGQIYLHDIRESSLINAKKRFKRSGYNNVQFHSDLANIEKFGKKFDYIILDVPCTGTGTIKRNPDIKYKITKDLIKYQVELQKSLLKQSLNFIKDNGHIIYITCSLLEEENNLQINNFLKKNKKISKLEEQILLPKIGGGDGFYYSILKFNN